MIVLQQPGASFTMELKSCAVFCGASAGARPIYMQAAQALVRRLCRHQLHMDADRSDVPVQPDLQGEELVHRNIRLVYGGGSVGLMGQVARTVSAGLGELVCHALYHVPA